MSNYFGKQPSSRPIKNQALAYGGNATSVPSTNFTPQTLQIRVVSEVQGWLQIGDGTSVAATVASCSLKISPLVGGEYFTVRPGQCAFNSTSTSTGFVSITELA